MQKIRNSKIEGIIAEITDQYAYADTSERPWIIGFSGGKDSTVLLTLVWIALERLRELPTPFQLRRPVYVVCNDTMVENPIISSYVTEVLSKIEKAARDLNLPFYVRRTTPKLEETYWINVLGKGYPVPSNTFRWCTTKLKIGPTSSFLLDQIDEKGEAIVLLGTRYEESKSRERSMKKHEVRGNRLSRHNSTANTYVFAPLKDLQLEEIWYIINAVESPWGFDNSILFQIYADASADDYECPTVITNKEHTSCGQSRFGCWTCTVVKRDKSMSALIENGQDWMRPLLNFRDKMYRERNDQDKRSDTGRGGNTAVTEDGRKYGPYYPWYRAHLLKELLSLQKTVQETKPHVTLITNQELIAIQVMWNRDLSFDYNVGAIYREIYEREISTTNINSLSQTERRVLEDVCRDDAPYFTLIKNLLTIQETKNLMLSKYGLHNDVERRIETFLKETAQ